MNNPLQDLKDDLAFSSFDMTVTQALEQGICVSCKQPPTFYSEPGKAEYPISGLCEPCFDRIAKEPEE